MDVEDYSRSNGAEEGRDARVEVSLVGSGAVDGRCRRAPDLWGMNLRG